METTYRVKGKKSGVVYVFKYSLKGNLKGFEFIDFELEEPKQIDWFRNNFPMNIEQMKFWQNDPVFKKRFDVTIIPFDLSFTAFWEKWNLKVKKELSEKAWNKLTEDEKIKSFLNLKPYQDHLIKTGQAKAHLVTWLNQKRYNDEY